MSERGVRSLPECEYAHYNLGRQLRACGRVRESSAAYASAVRLNPTEVQYINGYGTALQARRVCDTHTRVCDYYHDYRVITIMITM